MAPSDSPFPWLPVILVGGAVAVLLLISWIFIFKKAREPGWKMLIPIYNIYCQYRIANTEQLFWITISTSLSSYILYLLLKALASGTGVGAAPSPALDAIATVHLCLACALVLAFFALFCIRLGRSFHKSVQFQIGLILLHPVFIAILAFGPSCFGGYVGGLDMVQPTKELWKCPGCGSEIQKSRTSCPHCGQVR